MEQEQHFAKVFDLDCIWNLRFGAHANCIWFNPMFYPMYSMLFQMDVVLAIDSY